tara:strand:- start:1257 stop:1589 length:333 start_codon:yes stop_codon:yes gene_type:complete
MRSARRASRFERASRRGDVDDAPSTRIARRRRRRRAAGASRVAPRRRRHRDRTRTSFSRLYSRVERASRDWDAPRVVDVRVDALRRRDDREGRERRCGGGRGMRSDAHGV